MSDGIGGRFGLGPIDQVAYVVADMQRALPRYEALFGPFEISEATAEVVRVAGEISAVTGGAFDITVRPLVNAWGFGAVDTLPEPPDPETLEALREPGPGGVQDVPWMLAVGAVDELRKFDEGSTAANKAALAFQTLDGQDNYDGYLKSRLIGARCDYRKFSYKIQGLDFRLTGVEPAKVVKAILA